MESDKSKVCEMIGCKELAMITIVLAPGTVVQVCAKHEEEVKE